MSSNRHPGKANIRTIKLLALAAVLLSTSTLGATDKGPDAALYIATNNTVYSFIDLVGGGGSASVLANTDDGVALLTLPFSFQYYGNNYTLICVSSNGLITFVTSATACSSATVDFANTDLTSSATPGDAPTLVPYWTDLTFATPGAGAVYYQAQGTAGSRQFIVEWSNAYPQSPQLSVSPVTFEVIFYEGTNQVLFQYQTVTLASGNPSASGATATVGIRDSGGNTNNRQIAWSYDAPVLADSTAILFKATAIRYLVGDAFPYTADSAGNFGDGLLNTLDLITALRAVTNLPGFRPATCADRFDVMDAYPADGGSDPTILAGRPGGDGLLDTRDLIVTLRRVTNIDTSRPTRVARGLTCPAGASPQSRTVAAQPEGSLEFGTPVANNSGGWRIPILLRAKADLDLQGLSFSAGYDSVSPSAQINFVSAGKKPGLVDHNLPGKIAMAWLDGWQAQAGQVVEMGYLETSLSAELLRIYGVSANAVSGGRTVEISLPQQYHKVR